MASFITKWNLLALKQSFSEIANRMESERYLVCFKPELYDDLSEDDLDSLQQHLVDCVALRGHEKYAYWAASYQRLNRSFPEHEESVLFAECQKSVAAWPFSEVSTPLLLLLMGEAYLIEREYRPRATEIDPDVPAHVKEARLKALNRAKQRANKIAEAATAIEKAVEAFKVLMRKTAAGMILPGVGCYFEEVLTELWRREYNQVRPHSSLGYTPPAPEAASGPLIAATS
jgi:hypothetical protein